MTLKNTLHMLLAISFITVVFSLVTIAAISAIIVFMIFIVGKLFTTEKKEEKSSFAVHGKFGFVSIEMLEDYEDAMTEISTAISKIDLDNASFMIDRFTGLYGDCDMHTDIVDSYLRKLTVQN